MKRRYVSFIRGPTVPAGQTAGASGTDGAFSGVVFTSSEIMSDEQRKGAGGDGDKEEEEEVDILLKQWMEETILDGNAMGDADTKKGKGEKGKEEEENVEGDTLDWVDRTNGQEFALLLFAVPDKFDGGINDDWAWMFAGAFPTLEAAEAEQERLIKIDDRFDTMVCQMYDGIARFPPKDSEYNGRIRYKNEHMQKIHDEHRSAQKESRELIETEAQKRILSKVTTEDGEEVPDANADSGQLFPLPTTTVTASGVRHGIVDADAIVDKGIDGTARTLVPTVPIVNEELAS